MQRKHKIIITSVLFIIFAICSVCILSAMDNNDKSNKDNKKRIEKNTKSKINKHNISDSNKKENDESNNKSAQHTHKWIEDGYYSDESGWKSEPTKKIILDGPCRYICASCDKYMYDTDIKSIDDLRQHLKECLSYQSKHVNVDSLTDEQVLNEFYISRQIDYQVFIHTGYKCETCGKKISDQEAVDLGISTWDEIRHKIH